MRTRFFGVTNDVDVTTCFTRKRSAVRTLEEIGACRVAVVVDVWRVVAHLISDQSDVAVSWRERFTPSGSS
jgi:hypothetical protein